MNRSILTLIALIFLVDLYFPSDLSAHGKSGYVTLHSNSNELLRAFNEKVVLSQKLGYLIRNRDVLTVEDEVLAKLDAIVEKSEEVLNMFPKNLHIDVVFLETADDVSKVFAQKYQKNIHQIAFYSLSEDTIYISVKDARIGVIAHEIGHGIIDQYYKDRPSYSVHELMAQFCEMHIAD